MGTETTSTSFTAAPPPRFRQRKISLKQQLRITWQKDLPSNAEDVRGDLLGIVETGVDKNEEAERHLQAVLSASGTSSTAFIPTPKATKKWDEYTKFYKPGWTETESYIRSSATVEDAQGNEYNMDEEDKKFLDEMNADKPAKQQCTEDEFETICTLSETIVAEKQPFLNTDPEKLLGYEELEKHIVKHLKDRELAAQDPLNPERLLLEAKSPDYAPKLVGSPHRTLLASVKTFGAKIYEHWRARKIARHGKSVFPTLKFESGLASDDSDPYVCFRHREVRHSRKTRRTDQQNSGRLRKLHSEMKDAQTIFKHILDRERKRYDQIQTDLELFEMRCRVKAMKRKLKIGPEPDDVELFVSVPKRVRLEEQARARREENERQRKAQLAKEKLEREREKREAARAAAADSHRDSHHRDSRSSKDSAAASAAAAEARRSNAAMISGSRIPDLDRLTVAKQFADRDAALEAAVTEKLRQRRESDKGWINSTEDTSFPFVNYFRSSPLPSPPQSDDDDDEEPPHKLRRLNDGSENRPASQSGSSSELHSKDQSRLHLPVGKLNAEDAPEVFEFSGDPETDIQGPQRFCDVDFIRDPERFSVSRHAPQAICRLRKFGNTTYVDRILPPSENPLTQFATSTIALTKTEEDERLADRFKFDNDYELMAADSMDALVNDPAKLNGIDPVTQSLRFGSMLTAKACELLAETQNQRRRAVQAMLKRQQQQAQQRAVAEAQAQQAAQVQNQNNLRMQQGQRAQQRQQQRKRAPSGKATGKATGKSSGKASGKASGSGQNTGQTTGQPTGKASSQASGKATTATPTPTPTPAAPAKPTESSPAPSIKDQFPMQNPEGKNGSSPAASRNGGDKAKPNDKDHAASTTPGRVNDSDINGANDNRLPSQPPKVEASV